MMVKVKVDLLLLLNLRKNMPDIKTLGTTHLDGPGLYTSLENGIFLKMGVSDTCDKNKQKPAIFYVSAVYGHEKPIRDDIHVHDLCQDGEIFKATCNAFRNNRSKNKIITNFHISMNIISIRSMQRDVGDGCNRQETKAAVHETVPLKEVQASFRTNKEYLLQ